MRDDFDEDNYSFMKMSHSKSKKSFSSVFVVGDDGIFVPAGTTIYIRRICSKYLITRVMLVVSEPLLAMGVDDLLLKLKVRVRVRQWREKRKRDDE